MTSLHNHSQPMSLMEKWRAHYKGEEIDPASAKIVDRMLSSYFLFIATTELYVSLKYTIPFYYEYCGDWVVYSLDLLACFVFANSVANWQGVRCYQAAYTPRLDYANVESQRKQHANLLEGSSRAFHGLEWHYCAVCQWDAPPRTHHCKVCQKCILKRDHHCYMTGVCIGFHNQRYFVVLTFYISIASLYGIFLIWKYVESTFLPDSDLWDFVVPVTVWRWWRHSISTHHMLMVCHLWTLWWSGLLAVGFFSWQMTVITSGKTSHELYKNLPVTCKSSFAENFRSVFGPMWFCNFLLPGQLLYQQRGDGTTWPTVKKGSSCNFFTKSFTASSNTFRNRCIVSV